MNKKERFCAVLQWFEKNMPVAETELNYSNPFQLLVAVILSAQCTDKRVNIVTPLLFEKYPDSFAMASASPEEIFSVIRSISYPNSKSKHLFLAAKMVSEVYGGEIPDSVDELQKIPGVGRKTANVIASVIYDMPVIAVDTHVFRISRRLGLSAAKDVLGVERDLTAFIPENLRAKSHHWLILHGRYICVARTPKCEQCGLRNFCKFYSDSSKKDHNKV